MNNVEINNFVNGLPWDKIFLAIAIFIANLENPLLRDHVDKLNRKTNETLSQTRQMKLMMIIAFFYMYTRDFLFALIVAALLTLIDLIL